MAKVVANSEFLQGVSEGIDQVKNILKPNYGPRGRNTILSQKYDIPLAVNTGRKILPEFTLEDSVQNLGAVLLRDAALEVDKLTGDGSITTTILAGALFEEGKKLIASGVSPLMLRNGIRMAIPVVESALRKAAVPAKDWDTLLDVAVVASDNPDIGNMVIKAFQSVGRDGIVRVTDSQEVRNRVEISEGVKYDYGFQSPGFINDPVRGKAILNDPYILLVNRKLTTLDEIDGILHDIIRKRAPLLIVTTEMDSKLINFLHTYNHKGIMHVVVGNAPGHGSTRRRHMHALAAKIGAIVVDEDCGLDLKRCGLEICGRAEQVILDKDSTLIHGLWNEDKNSVESLRKYTTKLLKKADASYEIEKLQDTLAILDGTSAKLIAGGVTEYEMFESMHLMESAVSAVYAAIRSGVLPGGGKAFLLCIPDLDRLIETTEDESQMGLQCVKQALRMPSITLAYNAGENGTYIESQLSENVHSPSWGYNAAAHSFCDLTESGILDSTETICSAFRVAAETAATLLSASAAVICND